MTLSAVGALCGIVFGALGFLIAYLTLTRSKHKADEEEGQSKGVIASDVGYIKAGIDDLKREGRETRVAISSLSERVTRCEESCKQAHRRIDEIHAHQEHQDRPDTDKKD